MEHDRKTFGQAQWITISEPERQSEMQKKNAWENRLAIEDQFSLIEDNGGVVLLKKSFSVHSLRQATVSATALGVYELWCNGERVGRVENGRTVYDELKPGWTDYRRRVYAYTYDLSPYLREGENTLLAAVAVGWYCGRISTNTYQATHTAFWCRMELEDADGARTLVSDDSWQGCRGSAIRTSDLWDGELYDARFPSPAEISAGALVDFGGVVCEVYDTEICDVVGPPVRVRESLTRRPKSIEIYRGTEDNGTDFGRIRVVRRSHGRNSFRLAAGEAAVIDLGQNMVGVPSLTLRGAPGTELLIRVGEMLNDSGSRARGNDHPAGAIYSINYRSAKAKAQYVLRGTPEGESYCPTFTFFGFRYLEISASDRVEITSLECRVLGSEIPEIGRMQTSHPAVNQLISNILWGQRSNYLSVPTDCPQRDERLGWTGDTQAFCGTAAYNADVRSFFKKWLQDVRDAQTENGEYPDVIPHTRVVGTGASAWGDAGIIVPYVMWRMYGDVEFIRAQYESMERYMAWLATTGKKGARARYGDWLAYEKTAKELISIAYYVMDAGYMAAMSQAIGRTERAEDYRALRQELIAEFRRVYCDADGRLLPAHCTQTGYLLALKLGLLPAELRAEATARLKEKIIANGYRLSTGFVGSCILCDVLAEVGENDLAYSLLLQTQNPSWLYSIEQGATTIWERWNSYTKADGFGDVGMNSFNHYAYGAVQEWMYRHLAGIQSTEEAPGFAHPVIAPQPDTRRPEEIPEGQERITHVKTTYASAAGEIYTEWDTSRGFVLRVQVPVDGTLYLPILTDADTMRVNGRERRIRRQTRLGREVMEIALRAGTRYVFRQI